MALINKARNVLNNLFQKHDRNLLTPDEFTDSCKYVQGKMVREGFDFLNNIKNNARIGRVGKNDYDKERYYKNVIRGLISTSTLTYNTTTDTFDLPEDYSLASSIYFSGNEVEEASQDERFIMNIDEIGVDETYPVYFMGSTDIEIVPDSITSGVKMYYYRLPKDPKWTYNVVGGKAVFDGDKSDFQDLELPEDMFDEIIRELAIYWGLQLKQPDVAQFMGRAENENEQLKRAN